MTVATYAAAQLLRVLPRERITRAVRCLRNAKVPRPLLNGFLKFHGRTYRVDMSAATQPIDAYESFNAFFTRALQRGNEIEALHLGSTAVVSVDWDTAPPWKRTPRPILFGEPLDCGSGQ
jgi:hypothetical protein